MERMFWDVEVDGHVHEVCLDWTYWGGYRGVRLDGAVVAESAVPMRWRSLQPFPIGSHSAAVRTRPSGPVSPYFVIELEVDGTVVAPRPGPRSRWQR